jgi:hypothetical protein
LEDRQGSAGTPANEGRESGIGGERRIFLPKREGYKYKHISYDNAKKAAQNKRMYAKYENVRWKGHGACNNVWRKGYVCVAVAVPCRASKSERGRPGIHS